MKANEFVKKFGWEHAKLHIDNMEAVQIGNNHQEYIDDLKRLVESHELVESWGGIGRCKFFMKGMKLNKCDSVKCPKTGMIVSRVKMEKAIADVESCQVEGD